MSKFIVQEKRQRPATLLKKDSGTGVFLFFRNF